MTYPDDLILLVSQLKERLNSDCLTLSDISSPRKGIGWFVTLAKKVLRKITNPYSRMILSKQYQFNKELVPIHLATILSLQKIKDRLNELEDVAKKILDIQEDILEDRNENNQSVNKF
jgi:hypothetical protein